MSTVGAMPNHPNPGSSCKVADLIAAARSFGQGLDFTAPAD